MGRVVVAGLGPAGPELLTTQTSAAIESATTVRLRTARHPAAVVVGAPTYDHFYESSDTFDDVYRCIVDDLVELSSSGDVLYLVPGAPSVAETTVRMLLDDPRVECELLAAMSFLDLSWSRLGVDPVADGVSVVDGHRFETEARGRQGPLMVAQCSSRHVLSQIKLSFDDGPESAVLLHHLGLDDERVETVAWADIDRTLEADHLTSLYIPAPPDPPGAAVVRFDELVRHLRSECPWDREQTHGSLRRFLVEETYEVLGALDEVAADADDDVAHEHLRDELGDLLFQIVFHATLAAESDRFDLDDVATGIHDKLVRRHPHVFEDDPSTHLSWEETKAAERLGSPEQGTLDELPPLPSLALAAKVASKVANAGFAWPSASGAWAKVDEEIDELRSADGVSEIEHELGDVLFSVVTLGRELGVDADTALRTAVARFGRRFGALERVARSEGVDLHDLGIDELLVRWTAAKASLDS